MDNNVVVLGAGGFIGSWMSRYLMGNGYSVTGVDIKEHEWMEKSEFCDEFLKLDLRNMDNVNKVVKGKDEVYQFAADMGGIGFIMAKHADVISNSVTINRNVAEACRIFDVDKVFFSSSACIYPEYLQDEDFEKLSGSYVLKESDAFPADPDSFYGFEKLFSELLYWAYHLDYGLDIRIARYHNIQGTMTTWQEPRCKAPAALCRKIAELPSEGGEIEVWGDGHQVRTFLNVKDCCEANYRLMQCQDDNYYALGEIGKPRPPAVNIGSDEEITINSLVNMIAEIAGKEVKMRYDLSKPQGVRSRSADLTIIKELLNWERKYSLRNTMEELYPWVESEVSTRRYLERK